MDPELIKQILAVIASQDEKAALALMAEIATSMAGGDTGGGDTPPAEPLGEIAETPPAPEEGQAAAAALTRLAGTASVGEAITALTARLARVDAIDAQQATLDLGSRRELIAELVKIGAETPATAWEGEPAQRMPVARLSAEPLADMRKRVASLKARVPTKATTPPTGGGTTALSAADEARAANMTPAQRARFVELRASRRSANA